MFYTEKRSFLFIRYSALLCIFFLSGLSGLLYAQSADNEVLPLPENIGNFDLNSYMSKTNPFDRRQNLYAEVEALITSNNGKKSVMAYTMYTLRKNGRVSVMLEFLEPPGYKDTRILIGVPQEGGFPDVSVMMSFFAVPFSIKSLSRPMPFFGMDINSEDMNPRNPSYDNNRIIGTAFWENGIEMLIVESLPLIQSAYGKKVHYIDTRNHMCLKIEYFDKNGKPAKLLEVLETDTIDDIFTAVKIKMSDVQKKSHTVLTYKNVAYGGDHSRFINETYLRTGRIPETGTAQTE